MKHRTKSEALADIQEKIKNNPYKHKWEYTYIDKDGNVKSGEYYNPKVEDKLNETN